MNIKDVADLFVTATEKIEVYWNFYVIMLIALIGWLISTKRPLSTFLKFLISVGYLVFVAMNILGLYGAYTFAEALRIDLLAMESAKALVNTYDILQAHSYIEKRTATFWIHLIIGLPVILVIWLGRFGKMNGEETESDQN
jgi:hypothetical protein